MIEEVALSESISTETLLLSFRFYAIEIDQRRKKKIKIKIKNCNYFAGNAVYRSYKNNVLKFNNVIKETSIFLELRIRYDYWKCIDVLIVGIFSGMKMEFI